MQPLSSACSGIPNGGKTSDENGHICVKGRKTHQKTGKSATIVKCMKVFQTNICYPWQVQEKKFLTIMKRMTITKKKKHEKSLFGGGLESVRTIANFQPVGCLELQQGLIVAINSLTSSRRSSRTPTEWKAQE